MSQSKEPHQPAAAASEASPHAGKHPLSSTPDHTFPNDSTSARPFIDKSQFNRLPVPAIEQVLIELRVKQSRVLTEHKEIRKAMNKLLRELHLLAHKSHCYKILISAFERYLKDLDPCPPSTKTTPPAKS